MSLPTCTLELSNVEHVFAKLHDGIDHVLDALAVVGAEKAGSIELTYALAALRSAYMVLENELESSKKEGAS